jgi:ABC-2 type transport system ATP-binding protein
MALQGSVGTALEARALGKQYRRGTWALRDLSLALPRGTITALVGPNGAGKSTLMKAWVGFERPTEGSVAVGGIDPWQDRPAAVNQIGYVAQAPSLYRDLSVDDHLLLAMTLRRSFDREGALRRLRRLGIPVGARPTELSGGQQAQLSLAIALGTRAPVLLLDEPLASLDPLARRDFLALVVESSRSEGTTVVLSSHIITDVETACDRVVVLGDGRKLLDDTVIGAVSAHVVLPGDATTPVPRVISAFRDPSGGRLRLARRDEASPGAAERDATLDEVVVGYLAADQAQSADD